MTGQQPTGQSPNTRQAGKFGGRSWPWLLALLGGAVGYGAAGPRSDLGRFHLSGLSFQQTETTKTPGSKQQSDQESKKQPPTRRGWKRGVGWGPVWGRQDEVGALNAITDQTVLAALKLATQGRVVDLGVEVSRSSYRPDPSNPAEVLTFRSPSGLKQQGDRPELHPKKNPSGLAWRNCTLFLTDTLGTQIKGLAHATVGQDNHAYNQFSETVAGGDFGVRKCDAAGVPAMIARGVLLDIPAVRGVEVLPPHYAITRQDVDAALKRQKVTLQTGDVVLVRTGTLRYWKDLGEDRAKLAQHDTAGITLGTAKYLVQEFGVMMIASDTSILEVSPPPDGSDCPLPVHKYLLIEQGVHIGTFHNLEVLAQEKIYQFCYICTTNKVAGAVNGFALRPLAIY